MTTYFQFKGKWRSYQARVLENVDKYLTDGRLHLVAAPGSGKTTLGIECLIRLNKPALILVPSITIKNQWLERIRSAFLTDDSLYEQLVSDNLQSPKKITVATYQALHSAMTRIKAAASEEGASDTDDYSPQEEAVDFSTVDVVQLFTDLPLGVLCLDECHHLKNEWWRSLETFRNTFCDLTLIALTATPPYDSNSLYWERYIQMCGEVDEEITVPELVKEGSLCPHQDYVAFSYSTKEEEEAFIRYEAAAERAYRQIMADVAFQEAILSHAYLQGKLTDDAVFEHPEHLMSFLSYLAAKQLDLPEGVMAYFRFEDIPDCDRKNLETLLQFFLYEERHFYTCQDTYIKALKRDLSSKGLIEAKRVYLQQSPALLKQLSESVGKLTSIEQIVLDEYQSLGDELRLLILTDYIRKDYLSNIGDLDVEVKKLGVLPIFESLRRRIDQDFLGIELGILCGSFAVIPARARQKLEDLAAQKRQVQLTFTPLAGLEDYLVVDTVGARDPLTQLLTDLFTNGDVQVLIGTRAFLGEGWDVPCVNSLILASSVGSYMLSNQMRGRAIRAWEKKPEKTSNIWHLVTVASNQPNILDNLDFQLLQRRLQHFMGLSYQGNRIENGMKRLSLIELPLTKEKIAIITVQMSLLAMDRSHLKQEWETALVKHPNLEIVHRTSFAEEAVQQLLILDKKRVSLLPLVSLPLYAGIFFTNILPLWPNLVLALLAVGVTAGTLYRYQTYQSPLDRVESFGQALLEAMQTKKLLNSKESLKVEAKESLGNFSLDLLGGSLHDKEIFANLLQEFLTGVNNQRYIIKLGREEGEKASYYAVPSLFSRNKKDALLFFKVLQDRTRNSQLIYTRTPEGREELKKARAQQLGAVVLLTRQKTLRE